MDTMKQFGLDSATIEAIRAGREFKSTWTIGYRTTGGSYIIASDGRQTDSGQARDLLAILPFDLGKGRVVMLYAGANPEFAAYLESELARP